jgi:hypothetical protein
LGRPIALFNVNEFTVVPTGGVGNPICAERSTTRAKGTLIVIIASYGFPIDPTGNPGFVLGSGCKPSPETVPGMQFCAKAPILMMSETKSMLVFMVVYFVFGKIKKNENSFSNPSLFG